MDNKDKIIKELLENDMNLKAPQGFTEDVMKSVYAYEESKETTFSLNGSAMFLIISLSVISSLGVFYYFDNSFFSNLLSYFSHAIINLSLYFSWIGNYLSESFLNVKLLFSSNAILFPLALGIASLILIERLVSGFKTKLNLMVMSW